MDSVTAPWFGVSYFGNRFPHHAREDMRAMKEAGADFVVLVMSESDLRWNPGTMTELVAIAREAGLQPWLTAWAIGGVFGGETASYAIGDHPAACQRDNHGQHVPALCPRQQTFRDVMSGWLDVAVATGVGIVQWDEPQLALPFRTGATRYACCCDVCAAAFQERFGTSLPEIATPEVEVFNDDLLAELIAWLVAAARERGLESAVVLLPDENYEPVRAREAAQLPGVRYFGTTPFVLRNAVASAEIDSYLGSWADLMLQATEGSAAEPFAWVQAFDVPAGREGDIAQAIQSLVDHGVPAVSVWSYRGCEAMSGLACEDPEAAWQATSQAFLTAKDASGTS
jgi:hypothetical protein